MSGAAGLSTSPFTDAERADVRRFCGYPPYGPGAEGFQSWRFFQAYGLLEYRMTNMAPAEKQNVRLKLADLYVLEAAIPVAAAGVSTAQAAGYVRNPRDVQDRTMALNQWRRLLCTLVGVPAGPDLEGAGGFRRVV